MKTVDNSLRFQANDIAQFRYRCLQILETQGVAGVKLAFPGVSDRSLSRWHSSYLRSGRKLASLLPKSTRPKKVRQMVIPVKILSFLKAMRQQYPHLSKYKLKVFLDEFCKQENLPIYSSSWIGKVIKRNPFFFVVREKLKRKTRLTNKQRILFCPKDTVASLGYLQIDGIKVIWEGQNLYFLCALEIVSRQAFAKRVRGLSSLQAKLFLEDVLSKISYRVHTIQTDNGSEFEKYFEKALVELKITHLWSKPKSPKVNGFVERFNGIVQKEFIEYHLDLGVIDKPLFDEKLDTWLRYYTPLTQV